MSRPIAANQTYMRYVCGFMIAPAADALESQVLCVLKNRPTFQAGRWNGIGGKIEAGETPLQAQVREFEEEAGVATDPEAWEHTISLYAPSHEVHYYRTFVPSFPPYRTVTDEWIASHYVRQLLTDLPVLDNMRWILPLQLTLNVRFPLQVTWQNLN